MLISCTICLNLILESELELEIYSTPCGHVFHSACLMQWLQTNKTCPQCRSRTSERNVVRLYFTLSNNTSRSAEDPAVLQSQIDNMKLTVSSMSREMNKIQTKMKKDYEQTMALRQEVCRIEEEKRTLESANLALKDKYNYYRNISKETQRLKDELFAARHKMKDLENAQTAVQSSYEEAEDILGHEDSIESLKFIAMTLKKSLIESRKCNKEMDMKMKKSQNDAMKYKKEKTALETLIDELRKELVTYRERAHDYNKEKEFLKRQLQTKNFDQNNSLVDRMIVESPIPMPRPLSEIKIKDACGPTHSKSPYLQIKSSSVGGLSAPLKGSMQGSANFDKPRCVFYNGLCATLKEDLPPSPKRTKPQSSTITKAKFRKLAPAPVAKTKAS